MTLIGDVEAEENSRDRRGKAVWREAHWELVSLPKTGPLHMGVSAPPHGGMEDSVSLSWPLQPVQCETIVDGSGWWGTRRK